MGLIERRKLKELQESTFPCRIKEIEEICGEAIPYDVDWDSLADDPEAIKVIDNISCQRLNMALRVICQNDTGKRAVREGLKVVRLKNAKSPGERKISFNGGVLEMHVPYAEGASGMFPDSDIRQLLEICL
jgi:hypothetical protein